MHPVSWTSGGTHAARTGSSDAGPSFVTASHDRPPADLTETVDKGCDRDWVLTQCQVTVTQRQPRRRQGVHLRRHPRDNLAVDTNAPITQMA
jgi:hypothetical protein